MADAGRSIPATVVADELLRLTSKVLATLDEDVAAFEAEQTDKRQALRQLVERDREAVTRATERLNDLYRAARSIADNKGRRDVLEGILRQTVAVDTDRTFDEVDSALRNELKLARGITGAMRVPDIGQLLNQAAVQVDHLEDRANALEERLREATSTDDDGTPAQSAFNDVWASLHRDLREFDAALPLSARAWDVSEWSTWTPPPEPARFVRYGRFTDERLGDDSIPALIEFPGDPGLLIEPGRKTDQAVDAVRSMVLRIMAAFPPGSATFTFVDPKGLGESVGPFLGSASSHADLIEGVFAREDEIERQLSSLTRIVEEAHRPQARPTAPPQYRFVVVFDHPVGLTARSISLLESLTEAGPHAGVFTIVVKDPKPGGHPREARKLPALRTVKATKDAFETPTGDTKWSLALDDPPDHAAIERIMVKAEAPAAPVVDDDPVDALDEATWWISDATEQLTAGVGNGGGNEPTTISFDHSTTAVLALGRPGCGLTSFLHEALTNLALHYSPAELQLLMVGLGDSRDFEAYGQRRLPHARLVALEADRELVVSSLESAAAEVTRRLVLFQAAGVAREGYAAYRCETGNTLPRLVVAIDRVAEVFRQPDKMTRQLDELLGRIALDGAGTGVHLLFFDHVNGNAAELLGALPADGLTCVVLPCGRTDAEAVFGSNINDVELPTTPGEALVATHTGTVTVGAITRHDPSEHAGILRLLRAHADADHLGREPQLVDGHTMARLERAPLDLLQSRGTRQDRVPLARLWLGEPVALGSPVELMLAREEGANVLVVADDGPFGQGIVAGALITATLASVAPLEVHVVDLMGVETGFGEALVALGDRARLVMARRRTMATALENVRNLVVNRLARKDISAPTCLFVCNGIHRAPGIEEFDFIPHLEQIVRDGPPMGVHTLLWGTTEATLAARLKDIVRHFGLRVVGPTDEKASNALIDSPKAAGLRPSQALLHDEPNARMARFRPYAIPDPAWVTSAAATVADLRTTPQAAGHS